MNEETKAVLTHMANQQMHNTTGRKPAIATTRQERRKQKLDERRVMKKNEKLLSKLTPSQRSNLHQITFMKTKCKTHGQMYFLGAIESAIVYLDEADKTEACEYVSQLVKHGLELCNTKFYQEIFEKFNNKLRAKAAQITSNQTLK